MARANAAREAAVQDVRRRAEEREASVPRPFQEVGCRTVRNVTLWPQREPRPGSSLLDRSQSSRYIDAGALGSAGPLPGEECRRPTCSPLHYHQCSTAS